MEAASISGRTCLDGASQDIDEFNFFLFEGDLALSDARHVEQIVHQPRQLLQLPVDHFSLRLKLRIQWPFQSKDLYGVADWSERVSELVRKHSEEIRLFSDWPGSSSGSALF